MRSISILSLGVSMLVAAGCASSKSSKKAAKTPDMAEPGQTERMLAREASLYLEVSDVKTSIKQAAAVATAVGGRVEEDSEQGEKHASLVLRVPTAKLETTIGKITELGDVVSKNISSEDVTEQYVDVEARLKNKIALRDKLKKLLDKAKDVKDILAVEKELSRVQADIESMEGRLKLLKNQVELATLVVHFERSKILGPLGFLFKYLFWGFGKLFVIRS